MRSFFLSLLIAGMVSFLFGLPVSSVFADQASAQSLQRVSPGGTESRPRRRDPVPESDDVVIMRGDPLRRLPQQQRLSLADIRPGEEFKCNGSCLCKGAGDCVDMFASGCCKGAITCDDTACSCVNGKGC